MRESFLAALHECIFDHYSINGTLSCLFARGRERSVDKEPIEVHLSGQILEGEETDAVFLIRS